MKASIGTYFRSIAWFVHNLGSAIIDYILIRKLLLPETIIGFIVGIILLIGAIVNITLTLKVVYDLQRLKESQNFHVL